MSSVVLDNSSSTGAPNSSTLTANGCRLGAGGLGTTGGGSFANSLSLQGVPSVFNAPGAPSAQNELLLNGAYMRVNSGTITAPSTAAATATFSVIDGATPELVIQMNQTAPLLNAGAPVLTAYATANTSAANSVLVSRTNVASQPLDYFTGAAASMTPNGGAAHTQVAAADVIACPTITANSIARTWLAGLTGVVGATAVLPATVSAITPGTGFTLNGTIGAIYGYEILYA